MSRREELKQLRAARDEFIAHRLIDLIISIDVIVLKWTNILIILQGSALTAVWLILKDKIDIFSYGVPYREFFILPISLFVAMLTNLLGRIVINTQPRKVSVEILQIEWI